MQFINGSRGLLEKSLVNDFLIKNGPDGISFNQFLDYLSIVEPTSQDIHFQINIFQNYNFLVRTEYYKEDILKATKSLDFNIYKIKNIDFSILTKNSAAEFRKDLERSFQYFF